jgi:hypothetical protein
MEKEVSDFLAMPLVAKKKCPFKWWAFPNQLFQPSIKSPKDFLVHPAQAFTQNASLVMLVTYRTKKEVASTRRSLSAFCFFIITCQDWTLGTIIQQ